MPLNPLEPGDAAVRDPARKPGLEVIRPKRPNKVDDLAKAEQKEYRHRTQEESLRSLQLANEQLELENQQLRQDNNNRGVYAKRLYVLLCLWLGGLFVVLFLQGFARGIWFTLTENVLLAVVGGTTLNVLGLFTIVVRYMFPSREKK